MNQDIYLKITYFLNVLQLAKTNKFIVTIESIPDANRLPSKTKTLAGEFLKNKAIINFR
ncbi:hypothetical protein V3A08_02555 [Tenacibaculum maritimum]|uniref:hypothetical protein n=1 Tax=Tenacibaculum maritimum TaxID=107401 RepID=UPI0012E69DA7|nr:hypothetical protein DPIF89300162_190013 [Tenacibaculum maritimum]